MSKKYVGGQQASKILGVHQRTLHNWDHKGLIETIRTPGGKRMYNVTDYLNSKECKDNIKCVEDLNTLDSEDRLKLAYVRVSSQNQKSDLMRQKEEVISKYPNHKIIQDIGSGVNLNRRGLRKIINLAIEGKVEEVVIAYKDRLARFGYDLIEDLIKDYSNGKIVVLNGKKKMEPEEELMKDVLQIMNVFVARMNGMRKYKKYSKPIINK